MSELLLQKLLDEIHTLKTELATIKQNQETNNEFFKLIAYDLNEIKINVSIQKIQSTSMIKRDLQPNRP